MPPLRGIILGTHVMEAVFLVLSVTQPGLPPGIADILWCTLARVDADHA